MNAHRKKLAALSDTGSDIHIVADAEVVARDGAPGMLVMTACGKLFSPEMLIEVRHNQVSCARCRSVSVKYNHTIGLSH